MERQTGSSGMVATGGVDDEHVRDAGQGTDGCLEEPAFPNGEIAGRVGSSGRPLNGRPGNHPTPAHDRRCRPAGITRRSRSRPTPSEAHEYSCHFYVGGRRPPVGGMSCGELTLQVGERSEIRRPAHVAKGMPFAVAVHWAVNVPGVVRA